MAGRQNGWLPRLVFIDEELRGRNITHDGVAHLLAIGSVQKAMGIMFCFYISRIDRIQQIEICVLLCAPVCAPVIE